MKFFSLSSRHRIPAFAGSGQFSERSACFPTIEHMGRSFPPYQPVFGGPTVFVDTEHAELASCPEEGGLLKAKTPGFLRLADALLLYELAWRSTGDVLEIGSAWGLSTTVLCSAVHTAGRRARVTSVEIDPLFQQATRQAVAGLGLLKYLNARPGAAEAVLPRLVSERRTFNVAFVDHDHSVEAVVEAVRQLFTLMRPGGIAVFHDFNDERNVSEPETYGVYQAVADMVRHRDWRYLGVVGCCALVQRTET